MSFDSTPFCAFCEHCGASHGSEEEFKRCEQDAYQPKKTGSISSAERLAKEIMRAYHAGDGFQDMAAIADKALKEAFYTGVEAAGILADGANTLEDARRGIRAALELSTSSTEGETK
jgi:hypothetical protein